MSAPRVDPRVRVAEQITAFRKRLRLPLFWLVLAGLLLGTSLALLVARLGTVVGRVGAGVALVSILLGIGVWSVIDGRVWSQPRSALRRLLRPVDGQLAARAQRAYKLYVQSEDPVARVSNELAELHLSRVLDSVPQALVDRSLARRRARVARFAWAATSAFVVLFFFAGFSVIEGGLVLSAERGVSRLPLPYLQDAQISAEYPAYLGETGRARAIYGERVSVPQGTLITFRILPRDLARNWVLFDGVREVPFVSEGSGTWIARLRIDDPLDLRVGARHGEVLVADPLILHVEPTVDQAPVVVLDQAPKTIQLEEVDRLELDFVAHDDRGLIQIDLVVVSGRQEHRTELSRLDGGRLSYRGAHALPRNHPLLARAFLPVHVHVEARDGDTITGPKWGKSESITLLPPPLGFDAAERHRAFRQFRAALVESFAAELQAGHLSLAESTRARREARAALPKALDDLEARLRSLVDPPWGSLGFLRAQVESLTRTPAKVADIEAVLLATDVLLRELSTQNAQDTAKELARALDEIALGARSLRESPERPRESALLDDQLRMAEGGAEQLSSLGSLGADLGSVALADLGRAHRALGEGSLDRLERVVVHLAARLRRGTPSFGSRGSGGVESGTPSKSADGGQGQGEASASEPGEYDQLTQEARELADSHARELSALDRLLNEALRAAESDRGRDERLAREAEELRRALAGLPRVGGSPGTASSEAALAKNQGEAMADALEAGDFEGAVARGRDAQAALERAERLAREQGSFLSPEEVARAQAQLQKALKWAEQARQTGQDKLRRELGSGLAEAGQRERALAEKTEALAKQAQGGQAPLTRATLDALERASRRMREAAKAMEAGQGEAGRRLAEEAQRELERALPERTRAEEEQSARGEGDGSKEPRALKSEGEVPGEQRDRGRRFRERVQRGLGRASGPLSPAVERYAEGLQ